MQQAQPGFLFHYKIQKGHPMRRKAVHWVSFKFLFALQRKYKFSL